MKLKKTLDLKTIQESTNLAEEFGQEDLDAIGRAVVEWFDIDKRSRYGWEQKYDDALKLALQVKEEKSYPWPKAANVKFPLLTIASQQFSARIYPTLIKPPDLVKIRKNGSDPSGAKSSRAFRVSKYMSYQLLEEDETWEEQQDKLFIILPIIGCAFKKTYYDTITGKVCSKLVLPEDLVVHYYTKDLDSAERKTERFKLYPRIIKERQADGIYLDVDFSLPPEASAASGVADQRQGTEKIEGEAQDDTIPREILECHCYLDLDGDDYKEPYVVTVDRTTAKVLRILPRIKEIISHQSKEIIKLKTQAALIMSSLPKQMPEGLPPEQQVQLVEEIKRVEALVKKIVAKIEKLEKEEPDVIRIEPLEYYTKYSFLPSPDGGFYDLGFGQLLAPLNESVNSIINQLIDSGTLQNSNSGFLARGAKFEGGKVRFQPFEWKHVSVPGGDLKSSIVPLPVNAPSPVLFNMLQLIISYSERVSSVTEAMTGDNVGQNTPAYNMASMLEQGLQVFNGVFKRVYRSFRAELRKIYRLNGIYLDTMQYVETMDGPIEILKSDFALDDKDLIPAADPNAFSNMEGMMKAQFLAERSAMVPGYNPVAVEKRLLEAVEVPDVDEVYPLDEQGQPVFQPPPNPEIELAVAEQQRQTLESQARMQIDTALADSKMAVDESTIMMNMAKAEDLDDKAVLERAKLLLEKQKLAHEKAMQQIELRLAQMDLQGKQIDNEGKKIDQQTAKVQGETNQAVAKDKATISKKKVSEAGKKKPSK